MSGWFQTGPNCTMYYDKLTYGLFVGANETVGGWGLRIGGE
jgi:hypothetical protein